MRALLTVAPWVVLFVIVLIVDFKERGKLR